MPQSLDPEMIIKRALYELELMKGNSCFDYGKLTRILEGKSA